tara:strand:+ start:168 stop:629 length:462 start_codon:yes stop_codon:yes gene_type:complete
MASTGKKKFKETALGKFVISKIPSALDLVGDLLPDQGVLGVVKRMVDKIPDSEITPEDKAIMHDKITELYALETADRDSARKREAEIAKAGRFDFMFNLTGLVGLGTFVFMVWAIVTMDIPKENKEIWIHLIGICEGIVISIFGYFYGSAVKK